MIEYNFVGRFQLDECDNISNWIQYVLDEEGKDLGEINYIFCDDDYLLEINRKELKHNTLTDIISFDFTLGTVVSGDIYISFERVKDNAVQIGVDFRDELHRVMVHGVLHYCGYGDKSAEEKREMRKKEDYYLSLRTF
ncbi:rRNA maturation RNase YbeY [Lutimonas zeaxanthinifaciens]|uniref:rRNA maturation RNase YbeY n=1 Tax=Lutimonas zeaxanthinifaciens TaxID=3060215 RepID=UPI00265CFCB8|nr:rRNA maturation RNase YbeY [Lutimonas sp. YSD2104]WKK66037.1 rRNA maturation RNase YbeY [Lutimonas sp. YSD2104]